MKHYPRDNQTPLKTPFQPIAIVCQLAGRVIGAFSFTGDLCRLTRAHKHKSWRVLSNNNLIKDQLGQITINTYYDLSLVLSSHIDDF